jgi:hypothetical protein
LKETIFSKGNLRIHTLIILYFIVFTQAMAMFMFSKLCHDDLKALRLTLQKILIEMMTLCFDLLKCVFSMFFNVV